MAETPPLPEGTAQPKKSKLKKIVILLSLLLLLGGLGGGAYWFISNDPTILDSILGSSEESEATAEGDEAGSESGASEQNGSNTSSSSTIQTGATTLVSIPPLTINLSDTGASKYLKVGIDIELVNEEAAKELDRQRARIRDAIIILLSSKTYSSLSTTTGKIAVKNEIASRINQILQTPRVIQVYFTDFVVQ